MSGGGCWAGRISQDPNVCVAISTVLRVALQLRVLSMSHESPLPTFSGRVGHRDTMLAWFKRIIPLRYRERWVLADLAK